MTFWQRIRRLFHRTSAQQSTAKQEYMSLHGKSVLDVNKALESIYQKGVERGLQMQPPLYGTACPEHHLPLQETDPGRFVCPLAHAPGTHMQTQPLPIAVSGDFARKIAQLSRERGMPPGQDTIRMAALALKQKEPPRQS